MYDYAYLVLHILIGLSIVLVYFPSLWQNTWYKQLGGGECLSWTWHHIPAIPILGRLRQENQLFKASQSYTTKLSWKKNPQREHQNFFHFMGNLCFIFCILLIDFEVEAFFKINYMSHLVNCLFTLFILYWKQWFLL